MSQKKKTTLKKRVKNLRLALGYSQRDLAKELRVSASAVAHWEAGEREVSGPVSKLLELYEAQVLQAQSPMDSTSLKLASGGGE